MDVQHSVASRPGIANGFSIAPHVLRTMAWQDGCLHLYNAQDQRRADAQCIHQAILSGRQILMIGDAFTRRLAYRVQSDTHPALEHTRRSVPKVSRQARSIQWRLPLMHAHEQKRRQESPNRFPSPAVVLIHWREHGHLGNFHRQVRAQQTKALFLQSQVLHMFLIHGGSGA